MRITGISLWAFMALALAPGAYAQSMEATAPATPVSENAMFDQAKQGADLPAPKLPPDTQDLTRSLQVELKRVGCFEGAVDGIWGGVTKLALADFARRAKLDVPTDLPTSTAVETVRIQRNRVCPLECGPGRIERNGTCVAKIVPENRPARPQNVGDAQRPPRAKPEKERSGSGMCWRNDGRTMALVPCSEFPHGQRAY